MDVIAFASAVVTLRIRYVFSVTSWFRSPERNARIGGNQDSRHLLGLAVDIVLDDSSFTTALVEDAKRLGLKVALEGDRIHLQSK